MIDLKLRGKRVLITGGTSGFGKSAAALLLTEGAKVCVNYARNREKADASVAELQKIAEANGGEVIAEQADVSDPVAAAGLVEVAARRFGGLDALVHSAGIANAGDDPQGFDRTLRVHVHSTHFLCQAATGPLKQAGGGSIVVLTSIADNSGAANAYGAGMGAKLIYATGLAKKLAPDNIRVNCVAPGTVFTEMLDPWFPPNEPEKKRKRTEDSIPLWKKREGWPEADEVGKVILFLLSDLASHVTGVEIKVNGGQQISV